MKSERQRAKEIEKVQEYLGLLYEEGLSKRQASEKMGLSVPGLEILRKKYVPNDFEDSLKNGGFDPHTWKHGWLKVEGASIFIKNQDKIVTYDDVRDEMIAAMKAHAPQSPKLERKPIKDGHALVVSPTDIHIERYAALAETGREYNVEIAKKAAKESLQGLLDKTSRFNIDKIFFLGGHDILNVDNPKNTMTAGTFQDNDRIWHENFITARNLMVEMIETLMSVADVHVMFNPSHHDYAMGFCLFDSLSSWFRNCPHVTFDVSIAHRKYTLYGNSMIMSSHADGAKEKDLVKLMAAEAKEIWAETEYRYIYLGHIHHRIAKDDIGASIEYTRTIAPACSWSDRNGYVNKPAMEAFLHSKDRGQIARLSEGSFASIQIRSPYPNAPAVWYRTSPSATTASKS